MAQNDLPRGDSAQSLPGPTPPVDLPKLPPPGFHIERLLKMASSIVPILCMLALARVSSAAYEPLVVAEWEGRAALENLAVRPNGHVLVSHFTESELWSVDPSTGEKSMVHRFPLNAVAGIAEYSPDAFAVITGNIDFTDIAASKGTWGLWSVDMTTDPPVIEERALLEDAFSLNGITEMGDGESVIVADSATGEVYRVMMDSGEATLTFVDEEELGAPPDAPFGVDGVRFRDGVLYYTNIMKGTFGKVELDDEGVPVSDLVVTQTDLPGDDFAIGPDGAIYLATNTGETIVRLPPGAEGEPELIAEIPGGTSCAFGRGKDDKHVLYVTTVGGKLYGVDLSDKFDEGKKSKKGKKGEKGC